MDDKDVSNPFFVKPAVNEAVIPLQVRRSCTYIALAVQESILLGDIYQQAVIHELHVG